MAFVVVLDRIDRKIYDRGFHLKQQRIEGAGIERAREGKPVERRNAIAQGDRGHIIFFCRRIGSVRAASTAPIVGRCHVRRRLGKTYSVPLRLAVEYMLNALRVNLHLQDVGIDGGSSWSPASRGGEIVDP